MVLPWLLTHIKKNKKIKKQPFAPKGSVKGLLILKPFTFATNKYSQTICIELI